MESHSWADRRRFANEGKMYAEEAVHIGPDDWRCQMFLGSCLGVCAGFESIFNKLSSAAKMKRHFEESVRLCSETNPEPYHCLGQVEYGFAEAGTGARLMGLYGTFEKGLELFMKAEELCPHSCYESQGGHYNTNWLMIVKTYKALKQKEKAKEWVNKLLAAEVCTPDDRVAHKEALALQSQLT